MEPPVCTDDTSKASPVAGALLEHDASPRPFDAVIQHWTNGHATDVGAQTGT
ncbi:hypothetical protein [Arthrobacter sp. BL-252-APC-1A]|uniref:hypothetical protein n=1 Tax=Arthrobacter sp. BL-252-APC-1A TaxID=2606622 RepID=UPI0012B38B23|nr:hypothetical protein [Arthrobacter sp. BL-252-APC-1A]